MNRELYEDVAPATQGSVVALAHSATAARYETRPGWFGAMVTFTSVTSDLYVTFGDGGLKVSTTKFAQVSGETVAPHWGSAFIVPAGGTVSWPVAHWQTHYSVVSSGATGSWCAFRSSGAPVLNGGEVFPPLALPGVTPALPAPKLWLDFGVYNALTISSGIAGAYSRERAYFAEATNKPAINDAITVGAGLVRPAAGFTAASSHKLLCTDAPV